MPLEGRVRPSSAKREPFKTQTYDVARGVGAVRRIRSRSAAILLAALLTAGTLAPSASLAAPSTPAIRAKQAQAAAAATKLQDLADDLELKREDYLAVTEALKRTRADIETTERKLSDTQAHLDEAQTTLSTRAEAIYRGDSLDMVQVLLGTADFDDFLSRLDLLNRISQSDADLVSQVTRARDDVAQTQAALQNRENEQVALRSQARAKQDAVEAAVSQQSSYVASLKSEVKRLVKTEQARQDRLAAERARKARELNSRKASPRSGDVSNLGSPHPDAVAEAQKYLGVPYVWGGTSPSGFDCSGLVQYSYARIGISLPRTSREQFRVGVFIPADRTDLLEPGDLVFFGHNGDPNRVHHVGMWVGNGVFINAPSSGDVVKYSQLSERSDYVGAVRP